MGKRTDRELAKRLLNSVRGQYILAQALAVAIATLEQVPSEYREHSNIADMKTLASLFEPWVSIARQQKSIVQAWKDHPIPKD